MCSRHLGADFVFAWPTAEIAVMGSEGAANIIFRREIAEAEDPEAKRQEKIREYGEKFANPYIAAASGHVDAVIDPAETREVLIHSLDVSQQKRAIRPERKHGIPPF